jgi:tetratricopeptide (TPR) repeat protein
VQALRKAVEIDPGYAQAWAALARATFWATDQGRTPNPQAEFARAQAAAERAIALAPGRADGYFARAALRRSTLQDWAGARADLEKARALSPGNPGILLEYGSLLASSGNLPEAIAALREAAALDPLSPDTQVMLCAVYLGSGQLAEGEAAATRALEVSPEHSRGARFLGFALLLQGRLPEAAAAFRRSTNILFAQMGQAMVLHAQGDTARSGSILGEMVASPTALQGAYQIAETFAWVGNTDRAFEWLDQAVAQHDAGLTYVKYDPFLRDLRADPRMKAILRRLKLPPD